MPTDANRWTLSEQIGARVKYEREHRGLRQEDLVDAGSALGLVWSRTSVNQLEEGRRDVTVKELLLLPLVFRDATHGLSAPDVGEFLSIDVARELGLTKAKRMDIGAIQVDGPTTRNLLAGRGTVERHERRIEGDTLEEAGNVHHPAAEPKAGDAERKAARRLDLSPSQVVEIAVARWGRTLTAERDRRCAAVESDAPESLRAVRGHITRQLLAELEPAAKRKGARRGTR